MKLFKAVSFVLLLCVVEIFIPLSHAQEPIEYNGCRKIEGKPNERCCYFSGSGWNVAEWYCPGRNASKEEKSRVSLEILTDGPPCTIRRKRKSGKTEDITFGTTHYICRIVADPKKPQSSKPKEDCSNCDKPAPTGVGAPASATATQLGKVGDALKSRSEPWRFRMNRPVIGLFPGSNLASCNPDSLTIPSSSRYTFLRYVSESNIDTVGSSIAGQLTASTCPSGAVPQVAFIPEITIPAFLRVIKEYNFETGTCKSRPTSSIVPNTITCEKLRTLAQQLANLDREVIFRLFGEMNYSEKPYSLRFKGPECGNIECNTPEAFAEAWVLLKKLFNRSGASKVKFSFNVSCGSEIKTTNGNTIGGEPEQRDFHKIDTKRENPILSAVQWIGKKEAAYGLTPGSSIQMVGIHAYSATYSFNNQAEVDWFNKAYDHRSAPLKLKDNPGPEFSQLLEAGISFFRRAGLESGDRPLIIGESGVDRGPSKSAQANKSAYLEKMGEDAKKYRVSLLNYFDSNRDTARGRPGGQWALTVSQRRTLSDSLSDF